MDPSGLVLRSDDGGPMKSATLEALGVSRSLSRPRVSNDNPICEVHLSHGQGHPSFPGKPFQSLEDATVWVAGFVAW